MSDKYVDSFVMPIAKSNIAAYEKFAVKMVDLAKRHGALQYANCIGDETKPGSETSYPQAVKLKDGEVVAQSWAVYNSREDRDRANKAIMQDEDFEELTANLPVDGKHMFVGGFKVLRGL